MYTVSRQNVLKRNPVKMSFSIYPRVSNTSFEVTDIYIDTKKCFRKTSQFGPKVIHEKALTRLHWNFSISMKWKYGKLIYIKLI